MGTHPADIRVHANNGLSLTSLATDEAPARFPTAKGTWTGSNGYHASGRFMS